MSRISTAIDDRGHWLLSRVRGAIPAFPCCLVAHSNTMLCFVFVFLLAQQRSGLAFLLQHQWQQRAREQGAKRVEAGGDEEAEAIAAIVREKPTNHLFLKII